MANPTRNLGLEMDTVGIEGFKQSFEANMRKIDLSAPTATPAMLNAKGDGEADDTAQVLATNTLGRNQIRLPSGARYRITRDITVGNIIAEGGRLVPDAGVVIRYGTVIGADNVGVFEGDGIARARNNRYSLGWYYATSGVDALEFVSRCMFTTAGSRRFLHIPQPDPSDPRYVADEYGSPGWSFPRSKKLGDDMNNLTVFQEAPFVGTTYGMENVLEFTTSTEKTENQRWYNLHVDAANKARYCISGRGGASDRFYGDTRLTNPLRDPVYWPGDLKPTDQLYFQYLNIANWGRYGAFLGGFGNVNGLNCLNANPNLENVYDNGARGLYGTANVDGSGGLTSVTIPAVISGATQKYVGYEPTYTRPVSVTTTSGSAVLSGVVELYVGQLVAGAGIPPGAYITSLDPITKTATMTAPATASATITLQATVMFCINADNNAQGGFGATATATVNPATGVLDPTSFVIVNPGTGFTTAGQRIVITTAEEVIHFDGWVQAPKIGNVRQQVSIPMAPQRGALIGILNSAAGATSDARIGHVTSSVWNRALFHSRGTGSTFYHSFVIEGLRASYAPQDTGATYIVADHSSDFTISGLVRQTNVSQGSIIVDTRESTNGAFLGIPKERVKSANTPGKSYRLTFDGVLTQLYAGTPLPNNGISSVIELKAFSSATALGVITLSGQTDQVHGMWHLKDSKMVPIHPDAIGTAVALTVDAATTLPVATAAGTATKFNLYYNPSTARLQVVNLTGGNARYVLQASN